jgi:hypothetical protein
VATAHTYADMQALSRHVLPSVRSWRRLLQRYSLIWTKPPRANGFANETEQDERDGAGDGEWP